jgi:ubiquitin-protein ligase/DNA-directed RNA polymerase subunit RPC12/RpoP
MIEFTCHGCGKFFSLRDVYAGKSARCKRCGGEIIVPAAPRESEAPAPAGRLPVRTRRLISEAQHMRTTFADCEHIRIAETTGDPPEVYRIEYRVRGLERDAKNAAVAPAPRESHLVEIQLNADYPRLSPHCRMLTPIFHPNIDETTICIGDHWTAGERLTDLVVRIGEMIAYQAYNVRSPLNGEAAMWADLHAAELPLDSRPLLPRENP